MGLEELLGRRGMGMNPEQELLGDLLGSLLARKMGGDLCGELDEADGNDVCNADDVKAADLLMAHAKINGLEAEVKLLGNYLTQFRKRVDKMAKAHKTEVERLTSQHQAETESLNQVLSEQQESFREERARSRETNRELREELETSQEKIGTVQGILLNGHKRPRDILTTLRRELGMPPAKRQSTAPPKEA